MADLEEERRKFIGDLKIQAPAVEGSYKKAAAQASNFLVQALEENAQLRNRFEYVDSTLKTMNQQHQLLIKEMNALVQNVAKTDQRLRALQAATDEAAENQDALAGE